MGVPAVVPVLIRRLAVPSQSVGPWWAQPAAEASCQALVLGFESSLAGLGQGVL